MVSKLNGLSEWCKWAYKWQIVCLLGICPYALSSQNQPLGPARDRQVSFAADDEPLLWLLTQVGVQEHIPFGIVIDDVGILCKQHRSIRQAGAPVEQVMSNVLSGTDYKWSLNKGVIEVAPAQIPDTSRKILGLTFEHFSGTKTTMQGLGVILSGYIQSRLYPGRGYTLNILSSPEAEMIPAFTLDNVSVEQIASYVVSLGSKGMWIMRPNKGRQAAGQAELRIFSYKDDRITLGHLLCDAQ